MNSVVLKGRLTKDIELKGNEKKVTHFSIAVPRQKKGECDFITCVAFEKTAEFLQKYFKKGQELIVAGHIQTGSYQDKDGKTVYTTDVVVNEVEFCGSKPENTIKDEDLPF